MVLLFLTPGLEYPLFEDPRKDVREGWRMFGAKSASGLCQEDVARARALLIRLSMLPFEIIWSIFINGSNEALLLSATRRTEAPLKSQPHRICARPEGLDGPRGE